jgi:hypothetical protein
MLVTIHDGSYEHISSESRLFLSGWEFIALPQTGLVVRRRQGYSCMGSLRGSSSHD